MIAHALALTIAAVALVGCAGSADGLRRLAPDEPAAAAPAGMKRGHAASRGVLAYAVAFAGDRLVSVELELAFALVVRHVDARGRALERARVALGPADYDVVDVAVAPDGETAWVASADATVRAVTLAPGSAQIVATWRLPAAATAVAVSPDGAHVATGAADGVVCLRRARDGALLQCVVAHDARVSALSFAPAGEPRLASSSWDGSVAVWRVPSLAVADRGSADGSANDVAFSPRGDRLAVARSDAPPERTRDRRPGDLGGRVDVIDLSAGLATGAAALRCDGSGAAVRAVSWTPDGGALVSGTDDRAVLLCDATRGAALAEIRGFGEVVRDVAVAPSGRYAAAAAWVSDLDDRATVVLDLLYRGRD